jgi:hypothetical protein
MPINEKPTIDMSILRAGSILSRFCLFVAQQHQPQRMPINKKKPTTDMNIKSRINLEQVLFALA